MSVRSMFSANAAGSALAVNNDFFVIDANTRSITPPANFSNFGVESDENSKRVYFRCPKIVGNNLDLTALNLRVNFQNAKAEKDQYIVDDVVADGDSVVFSWVLSRKATMFSGLISFIVCAVKTDSSGHIVNEWNTTLCTGPVLGGLEVDAPADVSPVEDVVNLLLSITQKAVSDAETKATEAIENVQAAEAAALANINNSIDTNLLKKRYANAITGHLSGALVSADDVSPIEHSVSVWVHGKNLWVPFFKNENYENGSTVTVNEDNTIIVHKVPADRVRQMLDIYLPPGTYTVSCGLSERSDIYLQAFGYTTKNEKGSFVHEWQGGTTRLFLYSEIGFSGDVVLKPQIEAGNSTTEYTPYVDPSDVVLSVCGKEESDMATYIPDFYGNVEVVSVSPTMSMFTNNDNVTVECEYIRDTTKVIQELTERIVALESGV